MTPRSPEQDWTVSDVKDAVKAAGIARERVFGDVLVTFPGENDAAPDLTVVGFDAERRGNSYSCLDVLAVVEVPSEPEDEKPPAGRVSALPLQGEDGGGDDGHSVGTAASSAEDAPGLQPRDVPFDRCSCR